MSTHEQVTFSVIVPVYNEEIYLEDSIRSVLGQSYQNFELILVDDGSTDTSGAICDRWAQKDARIRVFHKPNRGALHTRQFGIKKAKAPYCVFLDSDDSLKPVALETIAEAFQKYDCDCVIYGMERVYGKTVRVPYQPEFPEPRIFTDRREIYRLLFFGESMNSMCRKSVKKSVFHDFDYEHYYGLVSNGEDRLQTVEVAKNVNRLVVLPISLYCYSHNPDSITHRKNFSGYHKSFTVGEYVLHFLRDEMIFSENDFEEYRTYCVDSLMSQLSEFSGAAERAQDIVRICKEIQESPHYSEIYEGPLSPDYREILGRRTILFRLFRLRCFRLLVLLCRLKYRLRYANCK